MKEKEFKEYLQNQTFNVYKQEYTQQFKDNLPIVWDYWANKDLTDIPEIYHVIFLTDWNWGPYSKMDPVDRSFVNQLFCEYNKWDVQRKITRRNAQQI